MAWTLGKLVRVFVTLGSDVFEIGAGRLEPTTSPPSSDARRLRRWQLVTNLCVRDCLWQTWDLVMVPPSPVWASHPWA